MWMYKIEFKKTCAFTPNLVKDWRLLFSVLVLPKIVTLMKMQNNFWLMCFVVFFAALTRLLPHPANFTAVGAIALFGGTYFNNKRTAFLIPMAAMLLSDMFIEIFYLAGIWNIKGFHDTLVYVYAAFALTVGVGFWVKQNKSKKK